MVCMPGTPATTRDLLPSDLASMLPTLRATLEEQRSFRLEQLSELVRDGDFGRSRPGHADTDPRDQVAATLAVGAALALHDIEGALGRMDAGRYGDCERCGKEITAARLSVIPAAALCMSCQRDSTPRR